MSDIPKLEISEFLLEVALTSSRFVIVEGASDRRFFTAWFSDLELSNRVVVNSVDEFEIGSELLNQLELNEGNRSRVIVAAYLAQEAAELTPKVVEQIRCVADRDTGHGVDTHQYGSLLWTDFPALESYAVDADTLDRANLLSFAEQLPPSAELLPKLSFALSELFAVRQRNLHLEHPKHASGFTKHPKDLSEFQVALAVKQNIRGEVPGYVRPTSNDAREYSYGHDIAALLLAVYANQLKNRAGLNSMDAVEGALMNAIQIVGTFRSEPLFLALKEWVVDA